MFTGFVVLSFLIFYVDFIKDRKVEILEDVVVCGFIEQKCLATSFIISLLIFILL